MPTVNFGLDPELRLLCALLSAKRSDQDWFYSKQIPLSVFQKRQREMLWVKSHRERHQAYPSLEAFAQHFKIDDCVEIRDPLTTVLEPVLREDAFTQIKDIVAATRKAFDSSEDPQKIIDNFRKGAASLVTPEVAYTDIDMQNNSGVLARYKQTVQMLKGGDGTGLITSPWGPLNKLLGWLRPGEVVALCGRPSLGKTWLLLEWANHLGHNRVDTLFISKEMPTAQIADRLECTRFHVDPHKLRLGQLTLPEVARWQGTKVRESIRPYPIIVSGDETLHGTGIEQVHAKIIQGKYACVVIDGAYLLTVDKSMSRDASDAEKAASLSRSMKRLAKVTGTAIIITLQINRTGESKAGVARGGLAAVFGSDAWAQDCDVVMEICGERKASERVVSVHKSRESGIGDFFLDFSLAPYPRFNCRKSLSNTEVFGKAQFSLI